MGNNTRDADIPNIDGISRIDRNSGVQNEELTRRIIGCGLKVHTKLGPGFLESIYQRAMEHEIRKTGLAMESQKPICVMYDGIIVGDFYADILVEGVVIVELKAVQA